MIYFIRCTLTGHIKIGHAEDAWRRFTKIQSDTPGELEMLATEAGDLVREAELHAQFATYRTRGEWFGPGEELLSYIGSLPPAQAKAKKSKGRSFWGGMTDAEVSALVPVHRVTVMRIRQGRHRPTAETAIHLQRATGVSAIALVFGEFAEEALSSAACPIGKAA